MFLGLTICYVIHFTYVIYFVAVPSDQIDPNDLRDATGHDCISDWARGTLGQTHLGKRKM